MGIWYSILVWMTLPLTFDHLAPRSLENIGILCYFRASTSQSMQLKYRSVSAQSERSHAPSKLLRAWLNPAACFPKITTDQCLSIRSLTHVPRVFNAEADLHRATAWQPFPTSPSHQKPYSIPPPPPSHSPPPPFRYSLMIPPIPAKASLGTYLSQK